MRAWTYIWTLTAALLFAVGCDRTGADASRELHVFGASSLTDAMKGLADEFEKRHRDVDVHTQFSGSQALRLQIEQGARADVFASANREHMRKLREQGLVEESRLFAENGLVIVVPPSNPARIEKVEDLTKASRVVIGGKDVPVGRYTRGFLERAADKFGDQFREDVTGRVVSHEANVRMVLAKVAIGEADAGVVYQSDAVAADGRVSTVPIAEEFNVTARYPIAIVSDTERPGLAEAWIDFVTSPDGRDVLLRHGFRPADTEQEQ